MDLGTRDLVVTGAAGWLGQRLVDTLVHGLPDHPALATADPNARIRALALPGSDTSGLRALSDRVQVVEGDLTRPEDCARLMHGTERAVIFHIAGIIHPRRVVEFYRVNVDGTRNLLKAAESAGARRAVVMSSNSPIGLNPNRDHVFNE